MSHVHTYATYTVDTDSTGMRRGKTIYFEITALFILCGCLAPLTGKRLSVPQHSPSIQIIAREMARWCATRAMLSSHAALFTTRYLSFATLIWHWSLLKWRLISHSADKIEASDVTKGPWNLIDKVWIRVDADLVSQASLCAWHNAMKSSWNLVRRAERKIMQGIKDAWTDAWMDLRSC